MKVIFPIILCLLSTQSYGQNFNGILLNKSDTSALAFANIKLKETGKYATTNDKGEFSFVIPAKVAELNFDISFVGCNTTTKIVLTKNKLNKIYLECLPLTLKDVVIIGLTAKDIVKKAVASIPSNYFDSSYAAQSFYRQYQTVNNNFRNLIETQSVLLFNLSVSKKEITSKEALAIEQLRRSNYYKIEDFLESNFPDFLSQNPIYHLTNSSLNPSALNFYLFSFESASTASDYVINYTCDNFSSESHGIDNYTTAGIDGEARESGKLTIDKESFAFKKIERTALRNKGYNYPKYNNFVLPAKKFTQEFVEGNLVAEYMEVNNKWYLKTLFHSYTNEFFRTQTYEKAYVITECFELYSANATRQISIDLIDKFYLNPALTSIKYTYDKNQWQKKFPSFNYFNKETIYKDLEKKIPLEQQFDANGK
jgi:hypothetical protein